MKSKAFEAALRACLDNSKEGGVVTPSAYPPSPEEIYEATAQRMEEKIESANLSPEALKHVEEAKTRSLRLLGRGLRDIDRTSHH